MTRKDDRWLDQSGLNLIRIVIGSYFMAASLGLVVGIDPKTLFLPFAPAVIADVIGSTLLCLTSLAFMTGTYLRHAALGLALFVFSSSVVQHLLMPHIEDISAFWRDVTLVCAIILTYSNMSRQELRRANLMRRRRVRHIRRMPLYSTDIQPRRVTPPALKSPNPVKPARPVLELPSFMRRPEERSTARDMTDINLFANI